MSLHKQISSAQLVYQQQVDFCRNTTFIIRIEEERVEEALNIIKEYQSREQMTVPPGAYRQHA